MRLSTTNSCSFLCPVVSFGHGEDFMRTMILHRAITHIHAGHSAPQAASYAIDLLWEHIKGVGGLILLDREGEIGIGHSTPNIAFGWMREGMQEPTVGVKM